MYKQNNKIIKNEKSKRRLSQEIEKSTSKIETQINRRPQRASKT